MKSEVVIIGGGPGGASSAIFLLEQGIKPIIVESEDFPRFHIGESMTGAGGRVLRQLGLEEEMNRRGFPQKQGVNVYGSSERASWWVPVTHRDDNWNLEPSYTWQVRRSDFDKLLLDEAVKRGATLVSGKATKPVLADDGAVIGVDVKMADGGMERMTSEVLLDCSGQATWLANTRMATGPKYLGAYDKQIAIFSQVRGCIRDHDGTRFKHKDNTIIFYRSKYHWAWFIPLDEDVVSIGIVIPSAYFLDRKESTHDFYVRELRELHPLLSQRIPEIDLAEAVHVIPNYSFQVKNFCGRGFMCIGDSHRFIDPIFSFGLTVAMREAQFAAPAIARYLNGENRDAANPFAAHQLMCEKGIDILEDVLDSFWEHPLAFALFVHSRYTEYMTDMFAGRIYEHERQPSPALFAFRKLLGREGQREASYENDDLYSIPIGSRYHADRAPLWEEDAADVGTTETWLGPR